MASIRTRRVKGVVKYYVRWKDLGAEGKEHERPCPSLTVAKQLKRDIEGAHALGRRWEAGNPAAAPRLNDALKLYFDHRVTRKRGSTTRGDNWAINRFIAWARARHWTTVDALTPDALMEFDAFLRADAPRIGPGQEGCGLSVRSANAAVLKVRRWMAWLATHPECRAFVQAPPDARVLDLPDLPWKAPHAPRWAEMDAAILCAPRPWVGDAMWVERCTGLRSNQAMGLRWEDFVIDGRDGVLLHVRPELCKSKQERAGRLIPVTPHLLARFEGRGKREGFLVAPHKVNRKVRSTLPEEAWIASGVQERVWKGHPNHCMRYGFESELKAAGADYQSVEFLVGHAIAGAGSSYLDTRWALQLREAVALVPAESSATAIEAARRGLLTGSGP